MLVLVSRRLATCAFGQRAPFPIPDPDPEIERKSFVVADGFEVNLFAADPLIAKPLQINFDPAGRLWIASSEVYPQIKPGAVADDKVLIVEDRDHDGRADKTTVFARGLLIPTGIEPGDGGAYVANSTELLHFKDTDGDGKADATRVVLSGFGTEDTHHILHTLRWGYDGMLYFNQSIYIHSHIETPHGVRRLGGGGIWQFRPETMELEVFIRGLVNPWGHHFDRWGQSFATDGAGGEGINYCLPGAYYFTAPDAVRILKGLNPGSPKYCGLEVVSGRHMPEAWRGSLLDQRFSRQPGLPVRAGRRRCRLRGARTGRADQEQARRLPADRHQDGPRRGDLYRRLVQPDHPAWRGRFSRSPPRPHPRADLAGDGQGAAARRAAAARRGDDRCTCSTQLKAPEDWTRQQAKRVLKERGAAEVVPRLASWVKGLDPHDPEHRASSAGSALDLPGPRRRRAGVAEGASRLERPARAGGGHAGRPVLEDAAGRSAIAAGRARDRRGAACSARGGPRPGPDSAACASAGLALEALDRPDRHVPRICPLADGPPARAVLDARGPGRPIRFRRAAASV